MTTPTVTVPVEPTEAMFAAWDAADYEHCDTDRDHMRAIWSAMLSAAPAPEGGAVSPLVRRLAYGYAIMHQAICHMAGTSGASGRWYYDKASEAFGRVSPIHAITETSNPPINGDYFSGLSAPTEAGSLKRQARSLEETQSAFDVMADHFNLDRAQPPAREDAQPVGWGPTDDLDLLRRALAAGKNARRTVPLFSSPREGLTALYTHPAPDALREEVERLRAALNTPEVDDFAKAVVLEAQHQRERWPSEHDAGKAPLDWFWLVGYLAQKAAAAQMAGDDYKAKHHTISTAAALANWHAAISGEHTAMRPGIEPPATEALAALQAEQGAK